MEPSNLHHHHQYQLQFQDQFSSSSSSSSSSSCYGVSTTTNTNTWTPCTTTTTTILNNSGGNSLNGGINITNSSDLLLRQQIQSGITNQDLGFHWANNTINNQLDSYPRLFTQMLKTPSSIEEKDHQLSDMNSKLLLGTLSSSSNGLQLYHHHHHQENHHHHDLIYSTNSSTNNRGSGRSSFSQIYPTINVSNLNMNQPSLANSSSLDMNLQPLDLVNSTRYGGSFSHNYGLTNHFQHSSDQRPVDSSTSISSTSFSNGVPETKRTRCNMLDAKASKKSRVDSRASCPPFKVRKEKLGDRIAALQQLVAPFGKTDTASVLMEAIGYIKFLQNQVETLSVPYMKSSRNKTSRSLHGGVGEIMNIGNEEIKRDLKSRGLCLVPLSCLTYVTEGGGGVWPPPNFSAN